MTHTAVLDHPLFIILQFVKNIIYKHNIFNNPIHYKIPV